MGYQSHARGLILRWVRRQTTRVFKSLVCSVRLLILPVLLLSAVGAFPQDPPPPGSAVGGIQVIPEQPQANPGRPTVATPATLTPTGYVQFESGILVATHSGEFSSRTGFNEVMKLSVTPRLQALISSELLVHSSAAGRTRNDTADLFFGVQGVLESRQRRAPYDFGELFTTSMAAPRPISTRAPRHMLSCF